MKFKKSILKDILILIIPVIIMLLLKPILPDKVPIHWNHNGIVDRTINKEYSFILGVLPFAIYELVKLKYCKK